MRTFEKQAPTLTEASPLPNPGRVQRWFAIYWRWFVMIGFLVTFFSVGSVLTQCDPEFYTQRLNPFEEQQREDLSKQFLAKATRLLSDLQNAQAWTTEFDEPMINAWLADDFEENHASQVLPSGVSQPRIQIDGDVARIGFRYRTGFFSTVIQIGVRVWIPRRDVLAVEFDRAWCGKLPLPTTYTQQLVESFAHSHNMNVTWKRHGRSLVAFLELSRDQRDLVLQKIEIKDHAIRLKGTTGRFTYPTSDFAPSAN